jgi:hypothetical protein
MPAEAPELDFYATPGPMTDLSVLSDQLDGLAADVGELCAVVQGLIVHPLWGDLYGVTDVAHREEELQLRPAAAILSKALEIDGAPLSVSRPPTSRALGNCRDFSTVTSALLRHQDVPARARCGFATYFEPGKFVDHWVVERWDGQTWVLTDAQLDKLQLEAIKADFDPLDVPRDRFIDAGRAWAMCRSGQADPDTFGILDMWGAWFIRGNVIRDLAALNKVELLPWDAWGAGDIDDPPSDEHVDGVAAVTATGRLEEAQNLYESDPALKVPEVITSYRASGPVRVRL